MRRALTLMREGNVMSVIAPAPGPAIAGHQVRKFVPSSEYSTRYAVVKSVASAELSSLTPVTLTGAANDRTMFSPPTCVWPLV